MKLLGVQLFCSPPLLPLSYIHSEIVHIQTSRFMDFILSVVELFLVLTLRGLVGGYKFTRCYNPEEQHQRIHCQKSIKLT
jgi:hypothetical protein